MNPDQGKQSLLAVDAGNTSVTVGVFSGDSLSWREQVPHDRLAALARRIDSLPPATGWRGAVVASVVPSLDRSLKAFCQQITGLKPVFIDHRFDLGITIETDAPTQTGADRLVNAAAAWHLYGGPLVVVDVGTAVTVCAVTATGRYLGGAIAPGPTTGLSALSSRAEKLPQVSLRAPSGPIGVNTQEAMRVGVVIGFAGLVDRLVTDTVTALEQGDKKKGGKVQVFVTGGDAGLLVPHLRTACKPVDDLLLLGLRLLFDRA